MLSELQVNVNRDPMTIPEYEKALFMAYKAGHKVKYHFCKNGNVKLGNMWTFSKTYSDQAFYVSEFKGYVTGSCIGYCDGCRKACYVAKSYRYGSVIKGHAINTCGIRYDFEKVYTDLRNQILRARNKPVYIRVDQSGELMSTDEFINIWCKLGTEFSDVKFYVYTKAYDIVIQALLAGMVPDNFTVLISVWHEIGIREYFTVAHLPNVKAFVYDDHKFNYAAYGIVKQTECKAYDENGKLDHNITCDKCQKCMNRLSCHKVIFCNDH